MRYLRFLSEVLGLVVVCGAVTGCGSQGQALDGDTTLQQKLGAGADVITDVAFEAVVAEEEFTDRSKAPECLAFRAEINVLRPALLAKTEWLSLIKTQAWDKLKNDYAAYTTAKCPSITLPAVETSESCATARTQVIQDWADVEGSTEYKVVQEHDALASLTDKWSRARTAGCIDH